MSIYVSYTHIIMFMLLFSFAYKIFMTNAQYIPSLSLYVPSVAASHSRRKQYTITFLLNYV